MFTTAGIWVFIYNRVVWHLGYADFAAFYGYTPRAHWPYRPQTKGKIESGVKYVQRNALAGKRFRSWDHLNAWLLEWATTIADTRVHGTTHAIPRERFAQEQLTPLGARRVYVRERVQHRTVATDCLVAIGGSRYSVPARSRRPATLKSTSRVEPRKVPHSEMLTRPRDSTT
ncbi:MAG: hypothetical protein U0132_12785 [Gemmatimonadaceae bacterium]